MKTVPLVNENPAVEAVVRTCCCTVRFPQWVPNDGAQLLTIIEINEIAYGTNLHALGLGYSVPKIKAPLLINALRFEKTS